eukprot:jgi/Tetstr1/463205/TSEL_008137.t1
MDEDVVVDTGVAAKVSTSDGVRRLSSELLELCEGTFRFVERAELIVFAPTTEYKYNFRALVASVVNFMFFARGLTGVSCRVRDVHVDDYNITMPVYREKDYINPNVLPSPGAWFFFGHIAPLRHFQVQQDSAAVAFPVPPS